MLSENTIKKASLRFLKTYYKYREREGKTVARYDMTTQSGIIADGHLSFPLEDGSYFLATFEATSYNSRDEVIFKKQTRTLFWDSIALASLIAVSVFGYGYLFDHFTVKQLGLLTCLIILASVFLLALLLFLTIFNQASRYRYIYALEQFKNYHADEQWIALGSDVFKLADDAALKELKKQCVYGGFGLINVNMDETAHLLITPSRQQVSAKKRKKLFFIEQSQKPISPTRKRIRNLWSPIQLKLAKLFQWKIPGSNLLLRYKKPVFRQILLFSLSTCLISIIFYKEIKDASLNYVDETKHKKQMLQLGKKSQAEAKEYLKDSTNLTSDQPRTGYHQELHEQGDQNTIEENHSSQNDPVFKTGELLEMQANPNQDLQIFVDGNSENATGYDCARFFNFRNTVYVVEDAIFFNANAALQRMNLLRQKDINANILWLGCFSKLERSYIVYIDLFFEKSKEASALAKNHAKTLHQKNIEKKNLKIRRIPPIRQ